MTKEQLIDEKADYLQRLVDRSFIIRNPELIEEIRDKVTELQWLVKELSEVPPVWTNQV